MGKAEVCLGMNAGNPSASSPQRAETSARSPLPPVCSVSPVREDELHQRGEILCQSHYAGHLVWGYVAM